jgi:hypothetical protein
MAQFEFSKSSLANIYLLTYTGGMPTSAEHAKLITIEKWQAICKQLKDNPGVFIIDGAWKTCGFCMLYIDNYCADCPIYTTTGVIGCRDTPYKAWVHSHILEIAEEELLFVEKIEV